MIDATPTILVATWGDGLLVLDGARQYHEFAGKPIRGLVADGRGGALAVVDGHTLRRRTSGSWTTLATCDAELACVLAVDDVIYAGTDDARLLRFDGNDLTPLPGFDTVEGRNRWYAGSTLVNGVLLGPPLGVRSLSATADGAVLLANVHVGGIPRSTDGGESWHPTLDVEWDVHEVRAHPVHPGIVAAASASGLCVSHDAGATWTQEQYGLHAAYCSAVAFLADEVLVAASTDHFATQGAIYRRSLRDGGPLQPLDGLPRWIDGIADTGCVATRGAAVAVADRTGHIYLSEDRACGGVCLASGLPAPSGLLIL